ncbi:NAD(P)H-dependent oxidoreductase [Streptococcus thoraltensis]|uniref:NAD(P)H-dependent oxidoreductase n=1 Tax=Streptococcus thoraltensis TaxID=55085 RepID=UPI0003800D3B|nr:NAD(P)H-dependent oxidoreductase [Streptococcus thoraltensis]MDY4761514.1 NAD(P)H-dependent oxidoreductase [Streptococcus thoraltensis]
MDNQNIRQQLQDAYQNRVAIRVYQDKKIPQEDLDTILDAAWLSPSSIGLEGWRFVVLENAAVKEAIKAVSWGAKSQLDTASHFILLIAEKNARYDSPSVYDSLVRRGISDSKALEARLKQYQIFQESDMEIADDERRLWDWTAKQTYIALGNMMTSAALLGIDSCPIEGFPYGKVNAILAEHGVIDSDKEGIASMLSLGYRLQNPKHPRQRKERKAVISTFN